jgi:hypothetical protein
MKLLYVNKNLNLSKPIVDQLLKMGFEVDVLIESLPAPVDKSKWVHKIGNIISRLFFNDKNYFAKQEKKMFEKFAEDRLKNEFYDIAFFIRADMYSEDLIKRVRKQTNKMISYQWDGIDMYPRILDYYQYFDRRLVFDGDDIKKYSQYQLLPLPIYHYTENIFHDVSKEEIDLFYVGVGLDERIEWAHHIEKYAQKNGLKFKAILTIPRYREEKKSDSVSLQHEGISLEENEAYTAKAKAVVDFKMSTHNGVAFRFFECLNQERKFVSNNHNLKDYDFYHPDNIFITDFENFVGLKDFLQKPYHKIDRKIVEKYGIKNWLKYALDYGDYEPINLP